MFKLAVVAAVLPAVSWWCTQPILLRLQYLNRPPHACYLFRRPAISRLSSEIARLPRVTFQ